MSLYRVSFTDERGEIEAVVVPAIDREAAQESAIAFWESAGVVHGALTIRVIKPDCARTNPIHMHE